MKVYNKMLQLQLFKSVGITGADALTEEKGKLHLFLLLFGLLMNKTSYGVTALFCGDKFPSHNLGNDWDCNGIW